MISNDKKQLIKILNKMPDDGTTQEKIDKDGNVWNKVYSGNGTHFQNWLEQCKELGDVMVEEVEPIGFTCYEECEEKMFTIWMKVKRPKTSNN